MPTEIESPPVAAPAPHTRAFKGADQAARILARIIFPLMLAMGMGFAWNDLEPWFWRPVEATVMSSGVEFVRSTVPAMPSRRVGGRLRSGRSRDASGWEPQLVYRWNVGGEVYHGARFAKHDRRFKSRQKAWDALRPILNTPTTTAWVDPYRPSEAVLDRTIHPFPYVFMLGVLLLWRFFEFMNRPRAPRAMKPSRHPERDAFLQGLGPPPRSRDRS